jgi:hypothetical protein
MGNVKKARSKKTQVVEELYRRHGLERVVTATDVKEAMEAVGADLSNNNPANFLKDLIRKKSVNDNWPEALKRARISARQRYGSGRVLEFFKHPENWPAPFIDRFYPSEATPVYTVETASLPYLARSLGRREEAWLVQVAVNLRLIETQLAVFSRPELVARLRDITHLQMSMKTQPEIDALFVATYTFASRHAPRPSENMLITCEAKQRNERILEDQIREQVRIAFKTTKKLKDEPIDVVKPIALQVLPWVFEGRQESMIFVVEFQEFQRQPFEEAAADPDEEVFWNLPLEASASTLFRLSPPIGAVGLPRRLRREAPAS